MNTDLHQVPFYGLYGDSLKVSHPDLVHIEEIADRCRDHGWVINTHRHSKLFQIIYLEEGAVDVLLDGMTQQLEGSWVISIPSGVAHGFQFKPNSQGFVLSIDHSIIMVLLESHREMAFHSLIYSPQLIPCVKEYKSIHQFLQYIFLLHEEFNCYQIKREDALKGLSNLTLLSLLRHLHQINIVQEVGSGDSQLLGKFWSCVEAHYREHWALEHYANYLHISTSTLNRLCHKYTGESPKTILQERLLLEAKKRLIYTRQSVEEITYYLGFKDQGYFSRFFKRHLGVTPGGYRKAAD